MSNDDRRGARLSALVVIVWVAVAIALLIVAGALYSNFVLDKYAGHPGQFIGGVAFWGLIAIVGVFLEIRWARPKPKTPPTARDDDKLVAGIVLREDELEGDS